MGRQEILTKFWLDKPWKVAAWRWEGNIKTHIGKPVVRMRGG
jgi:hypothetical protein